MKKIISIALVLGLTSIFAADVRTTTIVTGTGSHHTMVERADHRLAHKDHHRKMHKIAHRMHHEMKHHNEHRA